MRNDRILLKRIIEYCDEIQSFIDETGNDIEDFLNSKMCQRACTQCIEQIGKSVKDLSDKLTKKYDDIPWSDIAGMRDIIAHQYHNVIQNRVWSTITKHVPELKETCEKILYELENP